MAIVEETKLGGTVSRQDGVGLFCLGEEMGAKLRLNSTVKKSGIHFFRENSFTTLAASAPRIIADLSVHPSDYLRDVLPRLSNATNWTVAELTPENWQKNLPSSHLAA